MDDFETGKDKIKKICTILKDEALQPAREEAKQILNVAEQEARQMIKDADASAKKIMNEAQKKIESDQELFNNSMKQACRQIIEALKQEIENKLFNKTLSSWLQKETVDPSVGAKLITALVKAIEKEGTSSDFSAIIPEQMSVENVNALLVKEIMEKLREKSVMVGPIAGGVQLKLHDKRFTLDVSDEAIKEWLGQYISQDFRNLLFKS